MPEKEKEKKETNNSVYSIRVPMCNQWNHKQGERLEKKLLRKEISNALNVCLRCLTRASIAK